MTNGYAAAPGTRVLAIDNDPSLLSLVSHMLARAGFCVETAADGDAGLAKIRDRAPDVVLCDVQMPGMDGFRVLDALRADATTAGLPFVLITALSDHDSVRRGMRLGADDFLSKPLRSLELVESVSAALDKRRRLSGLVSGRALPEQHELRERYKRKLEGGEPQVQEKADIAGMTGRMVTQTVLFSDIRGFTAISERLPVAEIAELLSRYLREACAPILQERGRIMKVMGDGLMAVFGQHAPEDVGAHAAAALRAGQRIVDVAREFRAWLASRFDFPGLPPFDVGVGIHTGQVMLFHLSVGGTADLTAVGDTVNVASRLEAKSKELGWPIVASMATLEHAGSEFGVAETRDVTLAGRNAHIRVGRIVASEPVPGGACAALSSGVEALLDESARSMQRFQNEARAAACLHHTNIVPVYFVGSERGVHFYAMQFIDGQTLADLIGQQRQAVAPADGTTAYQPPAVAAAPAAETAKAPQQPTRSGSGSKRGREDFRRLAALGVQAAEALDHAHQAGIVHRDVKPANLMLRNDGEVVLTDFGVAKWLDRKAEQTLHGEILGTPYYISPEQAQCAEVTPRTDLYSLGVIFYEMLTGDRPYRGETIPEILAQHVTAPVPRLPGALAGYQPLVDGMLAKRPEDRFANADTLLAAIKRVCSA